MNPRGLVPLFATAIQNATAISNEMRVLDLQSAFKMTCELQQHIVDVIFARRRQLTAAVLRTLKPEPDADIFPRPDPATDSGEHKPHDDTTVSTWETRADSCGSSGTEDQSTYERNQDEAVETPTDTCSNTAVSNSGCDHFSEQPPLPELQLTNGTPEETIHRRHRLVALETLRTDCLTNSGGLSFHAPCASCHLRVKPGYEAMAVMACDACPEQPAICSAQCFRWWHSRSRANAEPRVVSPASSLGATTIDELSYSNEIDSPRCNGHSFDTSHPMTKRNPLRRVNTKRYNWSRCRYRKPTRRNRHQTVHSKRRQPMHRSEEQFQTTKPQYSRHGRKRKLTLKYSPIMHVTNISRKRWRMSENSST